MNQLIDVSLGGGGEEEDAAAGQLRDSFISPSRLQDRRPPRTPASAPAAPAGEPPDVGVQTLHRARGAARPAAAAHARVRAGGACR